MTLINALMALAPALAIALFIYWKDKHEKEPVGVLVMCFIFGVLICFPAGFWNSGVFEIFGYDLDEDNGMVISFFMAFFVVGLGEELLKYLVVILYAFRKPCFNEPFDGIVYAVMVSRAIHCRTAWMIWLMMRSPFLMLRGWGRRIGVGCRLGE